MDDTNATPTSSTAGSNLPDDHPERNTFLRGFGFIMFLNVALFPLWVVVGVTQLTYVIPTAVRAYNRKQTARLQGVLVAAGLTFLLNGACFVAVFSNFNPH